MKRSTTVSLVLLGAAGLTVYALSRSGGETEASAFTSVDECKSAGLEASTCDTSFDTALKAHQTDAPRFEAQADCEKDYGSGKCTPTQARSPSGSMASYFVPALLGFAVARAVGSGQAGQPTAQPLYNCPPERQAGGNNCYNTASGRSFFTGSRGSAFRSGSSSNGFFRSRTTTVPSGTFSRTGSGSNIVSRGGSVSRGGFGSSGRSFSSSSS